LSNHNKNILVLTPGFPSNEKDYFCIPPLQEYLLKFKSIYPSHKINVITIHYPYAKRKYEWNGIPVISLGGKNSLIKKPLLWYKIISTVKKMNENYKVDIIHSLWLGECAMTGYYLSKIIDCQHICTLMGQDVKKSNRYLNFSSGNNIKLVALSKNQSEQFYTLTNKTVNEIIHWGIEDQPVSVTPRDIDLLAVGSLIPLKNYSMLISMLAIFIQSKPEIRCLFAANKGVEKNLEFTGQLNRDEIFNLMQRSRIFVHPSKFEGSGYVFAEALANGMNIVSFNVGCAEQNHKWFIATDEEDFIKITDELLFSELDFTPLNLFPIDETISKYASLYASD
jgi:glycosyltransferase involved in cell wall biosynthesis